jgi:uncharacterized protein (TIGR03437 family)
VIGVRNNPVSVPVVYFGSGLASLGPLAMNPSAMSFTGSGQQQATVTGGAFTPSSDAKWLSASASGQTLTVSANAAGMEPGTYAGTVTLSSAGVLQFLPVTLTIGTPALAKVVNAASYAEGAVSPGEVVALGGSNLGPAALTGLSLDADGRVTSTLAGVQVLFNGIAAPLVYVSAMQLAAVAPYELDGQATATVQVKVNGQPSNSLTVPVAAVVPGVFTADASGAGQGAILNSDLAPNGPARPAAKGETVAIYMTGEGQTSPAGIDGKVTGAPPAPRLPVTATIDGLPAKVTFAGEAPGIVSGVMQVNVMVPETSRSGQLSLIIKVGDGGSQMGVTVSVR